MDHYAKAIGELLGLNEGHEAQTLYVTLENGKVLVFLGAPVSEEDAAMITSLSFGEVFSPELFAFLAKQQKEEKLPH
jgi:hypothetical protein